jgi:glycosyltransferase involved in cell wall biosynthesis
LTISKKFCFFGNVSGALRGKTAGGGELQIALLAKALALKGNEVVIVDPYANEGFMTPEGIRLINIPNWNKGLRGIRLILNRIPSLYKILRDQNANFYYIRMRSFLHLIIYLAAKKNNAKLIQAIAQDIDVLSLREQLRYEFESNSNLPKLFLVNLPSFLVSNFLLKKSDYVLVQHSGQNLNIKKIKGKVSVFPNIIDFSYLNSHKQPSQNYVIHVGTLTVFKGAENLYKLILTLNSNTQIIVVGKPDDRKSKILFDKLRNIPNVIVKGSLDHTSTLKLISNAKALINTSNYEGFPNIFLEAWASGVPVISLKVNPGNVINEYSLGICCEGDLNKMKTYIETCGTSSIDNARLISYVKEFHDFSTAIDRLMCII